MGPPPGPTVPGPVRAKGARGMKRSFIMSWILLLLTSAVFSGCIYPYWWDDGYYHGHRGGGHRDGGHRGGHR